MTASRFHRPAKKKPKRRLLKGAMVFYPITRAEVDQFWHYIRERNREGLKATKKFQVKKKSRKTRAHK